MRFDLIHADCRAVLANMGDATVDSVVTDPPYHLTSIVKRFGPGCAPQQFGTDGAFARASRGFMGKEWDGGDIAQDPALWAEVLRVLKPGGHLVAFSHSRTYHRMACAIEDAGFEIRDQIMWVYGSGFPKSHDVAKAGAAEWTGWGTALKPAHEPICLARKPLEAGSVAANVLRHGTGAINIDGCRVPGLAPITVQGGKAGGGFDIGSSDGTRHTVFTPNDAGRFPANLIHDGSEPVVALFPDALGMRVGQLNRGAQSGKSIGFHGADPFDAGVTGYGDSGSAARFFYCAKASKRDRDEGLDDHLLVSLEFDTWDKEGQKVTLRVDTAQSRLRVIDASTTRSADATAWNIALFGNAQTGLSLPDMTSTTRTETSCIISSLIWRCFQRFGTSESTEDAFKLTESGGSPAENAATGFPKLTITSAEMASLLGADLAAFKTPLRISVSEGRSGHPTVKPTALMRYLVRLVTPPGGLVFDPFTGSGSTGKAAMLEGFRFLGAEMTAEYIPIARARIEWAVDEAVKGAYQASSEQRADNARER